MLRTGSISCVSIWAKASAIMERRKVCHSPFCSHGAAPIRRIIEASVGKTRTHLFKAASATMTRVAGADRLRNRARAIAGRTGSRKAKVARAHNGGHLAFRRAVPGRGVRMIIC